MTMRILSLYLVVFILGCTLFISCDRENIESITDVPQTEPPVEVDIFEGMAFQAYSGDVLFSEGSAKRLGDAGNYLFALSSGVITCSGPDGYTTAYEGNSYFNLEFYEFEGAYYTSQATITTEIDGAPTTLLSLVPAGSGCQDQEVVVTITELTDNHVAGTFRGDFFKMGDVLGPTLPCFGFVYVGEFTAEFSMPYEVCQ